MNNSTNIETTLFLIIFHIKVRVLKAFSVSVELTCVVSV